MSVLGSLRTMTLADVLQWVHGRAKSGTLKLQRRSTRKQLAFRKGRLHSTSSNDPREALGQYLLGEGLVGEEDLFTALLRQEGDPRRLGELLVEQGALPAEALPPALAACAREAALDSLSWADGRFEFDEQEPAGAGLDLDTAALLTESARRARSWERMRARLPSSEVTFRVAGEEPALAHGRDRAVFRQAAEGRSLAEISLQTHQSEFATAERLLRLCDQGLLEPNEEVEAAGATDVVEAIETLISLASERLGAGWLQAAQEAYENVLALDSLNVEARRGLTAVARGLDRERAAHKVPLDRVPILRLGSFALTQQRFDPEEAFVLSRVNGQWDVRSILKLCPMREEDALLIFARLLDRGTIELQ